MLQLTTTADKANFNKPSAEFILDLQWPDCSNNSMHPISVLGPPSSNLQPPTLHNPFSKARLQKLVQLKK
jgi:hypothetical protein